MPACCHFYYIQRHVQPTHPKTGELIRDAPQRLEFLVKMLERSKEKILIPTPAMSEFLVLAGKAGPDYLAIINRSAVFQIADFDLRSAIEAANLTIDAKARGDKRSGMSGSWAKIKFDRQIAAISKVNSAHTIYSSDSDIEKSAEFLEIGFVHLAELPPPPPQQMELKSLKHAAEDRSAEEGQNEAETAEPED